MLKRVSSAVWPSGAARATSAAPTLPAAPGLFSTSTGLPSETVSFSERMRPMRSSGPPAVNGLTSLTGFDGKACAAACSETSASSSSAARFTRLALFLVLGDRLLEVGVLDAREETELVELHEVLLRLG